LLKPILSQPLLLYFDDDGAVAFAMKEPEESKKQIASGDKLFKTCF
jgi:hypothetical protein